MKPGSNDDATTASSAANTSCVTVASPPSDGRRGEYALPVTSTFLAPKYASVKWQVPQRYPS
jgi:hypothetical protein